MNRKVPYDAGLIVIVLALLGLGVIMVFSTSSVVSGDLNVFFRHLVLMLVGVITMLVLMKVDYHVYARPWLVYSVLVLTALLLLAALFSPAIKNVHRWIVLGLFRAQPSELAKLTTILFTSYYLAQRGKDINSPAKGLLPYLVVLGGLLLLILREPDFGTAACIALISASLLYLGGLKKRYFAVALVLLIPAFYLLVYNVEYRRERILAFLNPEENPLSVGYQIRQSLIAVGSGGLQGLGLAQGRQKLLFLPEPQTDFIYAIVGEELGLIGCCLLVFLFLMLFRKGVQIALRADSRLGTLIGLGIVVMIVFQALINMGVVLSLLPTKGIPLPLISVGGSSMLVTLSGIGILLNISQWQRLENNRSGSEV